MQKQRHLLWLVMIATLSIMLTACDTTATVSSERTLDVVSGSENRTLEPYYPTMGE
jgi:uncharacterized lipoprotein YehR (DUF1307 family)